MADPWPGAGDLPRIGIDGFNLALAHGTGVATYGRNLAAALHARGHPIDLVFSLNMPRKTRPDLRESVFFGRLLDPTPQKLSWRRRLRQTRLLPLSADLIEIPVTGRVVAESVKGRLPAFDRLFNLSEIFDMAPRHFRRFGRFISLRMADPPAIMHWTYPLPVRLEGARNIYTLHDLVPLRMPGMSTEDKRYYDGLVRACVRDAAHVVTVSEHSRRDIVDLLGADPAHVTNAYQSSDLPAPPDAAALATRLRRLFDLEQAGYFLFVGAIEPKKNLARLIEAYLEADLNTPLVIVGKDGWHAEQELRLLGHAHGVALPAARNIRRIEYLPRALLGDLVRGARAVLFPALYEGFGLPALEALGAGVPLLAANTGALPEVVGDAALLVDPYDVGAIATGLRTLDGDAALRARLAAAGPGRAARFSQRLFGEAMADVYRNVLAG